MKNLIVLLLTGWLGAVLMNPAASRAADEEESAPAAEAPYRHVVLFKFKDTSSEEDVRAIEKAFAAMKGKLPLIRDFEWGTNVSPEGHAQEFTHCFFVTFDSKEDLEKYLPHQVHKDFVALLRPHLDKVLVVDYVARKTAD